MFKKYKENDRLQRDLNEIILYNINLKVLTIIILK